MVTKELLTAQELAETLGLTLETIWRYTREKRIPYIELVSGQYRYLIEDVARVLNAGASEQVHEEQGDYPVSRKLTYEDYAKLPNQTGYTLQLIDGCIIRDPSPTFMHQRVSLRLQSILGDYVRESDPGGEIFYAPLDVRLDEHTVLQPDLLYLPSSRPAQRNPVDSLPELVVEITSPSTARTDRIRKYASYRRAGIPHYWIADLVEGTIQCYEIKGGSYVLLLTSREGTFTHPQFPGLVFDVKSLFVPRV